MFTIKKYTLFINIILSLALLPVFAQVNKSLEFEIPEIPPSFENTCKHKILGYGFEHAGMTQYLLENEILESYWSGDTLHLKINIITDCCGYDYLDYKIEEDAIVLIHGMEDNLPMGNGLSSMTENVITCLCDTQGCCYEMDFEIVGAEKNKNYLVKQVKLVVSKLVEPDPIEYLSPAKSSIYYTACPAFEVCFEEKLAMGIEYYSELIPLYESYIAFNNGLATKDIGNAIRHNWKDFIKILKAIESPFLADKIDEETYLKKISVFNKEIDALRLILEPLMQTAKIGEPIIEGIVIEEFTEELPKDVYEIVDEPAQPLEGYVTFLNHIEDNLIYPENAKILEIEGKVYVEFIVKKNGELGDLKVKRGLGFGCDEEAIRLFKKSPKWKPARIEGKKVKQLLVLPVQFSLERKTNTLK